MENKLTLIKKIIEENFVDTIKTSFILKNSIKIEKINNEYFLNSIKLNNKLFIISIGKVAQNFAIDFINLLQEKEIKFEKLIIITDSKYLITNQLISNEKSETKKFPNEKVEILLSNHPELTIKSIENTQKLIDFLIQNDDKDSTFIFLISGGGSSILEYPIISPHLAIEIYKYILTLDLDIYQINTIRRFFSKIKGGKLLKYIKKSQVISLILSDVPLNDLSTIASGITFIKKTSLKDLEFISDTLKYVVDHYNIHQTIVENEKIYTEIENTNQNLDNVFNLIIADNTFALKQLENLLKQNNINTETICSHLNLNLDKLLEFIKGIIFVNLGKNKLYIFGGETNLKVEKKGFGGRLQHLGLKVLQEIEEIQDKEVIFFCFATDAVDGNTNKSGCILSNKMEINKDKIQKYLENFNSGLFFENPKNEKYSISLTPGINNLNEIYGLYL